MGFSCKQTHLIFYLEIGSGWPQNKDQPQRIDISQEAKNKGKRKPQLSQTNKIPTCRNLACLSLSHLHFAPPALPAPLQPLSLLLLPVLPPPPPKPRHDQGWSSLRSPSTQVEVQYNHHPLVLSVQELSVSSFSFSLILLLGFPPASQSAFVFCSLLYYVSRKTGSVSPRC